MSLYFGATEINGLYFGDTEITGLYFGDTEIWAAWAEYDGTLPANYSANGSMLSDYRIYGENGGVGDKTENLFDPNAADVENGCFYNAEGVRVNNAYHKESGFISVSPGEYTFSFSRKAGGSTFYVNFYNANKTFVSNIGSLSGNKLSTIVTVQDDGYARFNFSDYYLTRVMFGRGSNLSYAPYGYVIPISVSGGTTSTITHIYIGDEPLGEDEYISYSEQKIYRMAEGVLMPEDPPVHLPALPTINGLTITDYAGQSAAVPSRFVAKYRKGGH